MLISYRIVNNETGVYAGGAYTERAAKKLVKFYDELHNEFHRIDKLVTVEPETVDSESVWVAASDVVFEK